MVLNAELPGARVKSLAFMAALLVLTQPLFAQQTYVTRFDAFTGFTYFNSPKVSLPETGFHFQAGVRATTWISIGFDYSIATGDLNLTPGLLLPSLQQSLGAQLAQLAALGKLPPGYTLNVPAHSRTQTFTVGPQFAYRRWKPITLFIRPCIGLMHELATPNATDPIGKAIVAQLAPSGEKTDRVWFYGFGGGVDFNFTHHFALRVQSDLVRDHMFSDLLKDSRGTVRVSIGPAFNFGRNIAER
ncbi:MAG: hypothetical protein M1436_10640 [Acidobacteria bacterium]|nr:hypothetical protein [Acidobacteriota bacterium]